MNPYQFWWVAALLNILFLFASLRLAIKTNLIKSNSISTNKPYSFSKSQLFWWTLIILSIFIWCAVFTAKVPQLNSMCLALLGLSIGTTATGTLIDNADKNNAGLVRFQDQSVHESFLKDILSDEQGNYSIHRFQALIFNFSIGIIFIWMFINSDKKSFPSFSDDETKYILGMLGISNAGFAALKMGENSKRKDKVGEMQDDGATKAKINEELTKKKEEE